MKVKNINQFSIVLKMESNSRCIDADYFVVIAFIPISNQGGNFRYWINAFTPIESIAYWIMYYSPCLFLTLSPSVSMIWLFETLQIELHMI